MLFCFLIIYASATDNTFFFSFTFYLASIDRSVSTFYDGIQIPSECHNKIIIDPRCSEKFAIRAEEDQNQTYSPTHSTFKW